MGGQLYGNFLPGSLLHKFIVIVTLIIRFVVSIFLSLLRDHLISNFGFVFECFQTPLRDLLRDLIDFARWDKKLHTELMRIVL